MQYKQTFSKMKFLLYFFLIYPFDRSDALESLHFLFTKYLLEIDSISD